MSDFKEAFKTSGKKINEVLENGIRINVKINAENSKFVIYDEEEKSINENQRKFGDSELWRLILYSYYKTT